MSTVATHVTGFVEQWIGCAAPVAHRQQLFFVAERFGANGEARHIDLLLPAVRDFEGQQTVVRLTRQFERTQRFALFCQSIQRVHFGYAVRRVA
jgi:hypothetical protein